MGKVKRQHTAYGDQCMLVAITLHICIMKTMAAKELLFATNGLSHLKIFIVTWAKSQLGNLLIELMALLDIIKKIAGGPLQKCNQIIFHQI